MRRIENGFHLCAPPCSLLSPDRESKGSSCSNNTVNRTRQSTGSLNKQIWTPESILDSNSAVRRVKVAITDIDGVQRGKYLHKQKLSSSWSKGFGFCNVVFGWDSADQCYENSEVTGWHTGYPDAMVKLDANTLRFLPWEPDVPFLLGDFSNCETPARNACPRSYLKAVLNTAANEGYEVRCGMEFEWFNFRETPQSLHDSGFRDPTPITPGMFGYSVLRQSLNEPFLRDLMLDLEDFGVPLEGLHTETGPGVLEAAILHSDALECADRATLFKTAVKLIAYKHQILPTFMARWNEALPGTSGHIHLSLWSKDTNQNLFHDPSKPHSMSEAMQSFIAGLLEHTPDLTVFFAPTVNSYKRLVPGFWAPTAATWGIDNRTVAVRVIPGSPAGQRIEFRVCGADINPYIGIATCIAAGLDGIRRKLSLTQAPVAGNGYSTETAPQDQLPHNLQEACSRFAKSESQKIIPNAFAQHYLKTREWEWGQSQKAVTDWELKRYFEII